MSESNNELVNVYFMKEADGLEYFLAYGKAIYDYAPGTILRIVSTEVGDTDAPFDASVISHIATWKSGEEYAMLEQLSKILLGRSKMHKVLARQVYIDD